MQTALQRTASGGLYFVLQGAFQEVSDRPFVVGLLAGSLNGALLNPLAAVKYHNWGSKDSWLGSFRSAVRAGGVRVLWKGLGTTVARDGVFGVVYEVGRLELATVLGRESPHVRVASDMTAAMVATVFSAPFNYVRSIQFAHLADCEPPLHRALVPQLGRLWANAKLKPSRWRYIAQRLRLGWGTMRVAVGMGLGQFVFSQIRDMDD